MPLFTSSQINRYTLAAEQEFTTNYKCIIDRVALPIVSGTSLYTLSDNVIDIRRITYKGKKLDPLSHRDLREHLGSATSSGTPTDYVFNNLGQMVIKLFPTPAETLPSSQLNLFTPTLIRAQCIVEFYTVADGIGYKIPDYIRRRLLKAYVLKQAYLSEGKGQNLKAYKYWSSKWDYLSDVYGQQIYDQLNTPRRLISNSGIGMRRHFPARPQLPISMQGIGLDPGE
jgi:hypothetical protein